MLNSAKTCICVLLLGSDRTGVAQFLNLDLTLSSEISEAPNIWKINLMKLKWIKMHYKFESNSIELATMMSYTLV